MKKYKLIIAMLFSFFVNSAIGQTSINVSLSGTNISYNSGSLYDACLPQSSSSGPIKLTANVTNPPSGTLSYDWYDGSSYLTNTSSNTHNITYDNNNHNYHVKLVGTSPASSNTSSNVYLNVYTYFDAITEANVAATTVILNSTDASYDLKQLLGNIGSANIVFTTVNPLYTVAITGTQFDPSKVPGGSYKVQYTATDNAHCPITKIVNNTTIVVLDAQATLPSFLKGEDPLPICENNNVFHLLAYINRTCFSSSFAPLNISFRVTYKHGAIVSLTNSTFYANDILGNDIYNVTGTLYGYDIGFNPIYRFTVNPSQHIDGVYSLYFQTFGILPSCSSLYTGYIPIFPRRNPFLLGLPAKTVPGSKINLCSASNDTIFMRGTPSSPASYGSYNYYAGIQVLPATTPATYNFIKIPNASISLNGPANDPTLQKFVPAEIFKNHLSSDTHNVFKVVYTYPANSSGSCPDSVTNILSFLAHTSTIFTISNPASKPYCYGQPLTLDISNNGTGDKYTWDFGDGVSTSLDSALRYKHLYGKAGLFNIRFKTFAKVLPSDLCNNDTIVSVKIGAKPVAGFDVFSNFQGVKDTLKSLSKILIPNISSQADTIVKWYWDFGVDATTKDTNRVVNNFKTKSNDTTYTYLATRRNPYRVVHSVVSAWGCADSLVRNIPIFPIDTPVTTSNVFETFDDPTSANGWFDSGQYLLNNNQQSSWDNITPTKNIIKSTDPCWITVKAKAVNNDTSGYYNNEYSYVESPCYSLSKLALPMVSFNTWTQSDNLFDGATFQYTLCDSAFGKEKWVTIGQLGQGLDWYNSKTIISAPGGKPASGRNLMGWTGTENLTGWKLSAYRINNLKDTLAKYSNVKYVRFRIAFSSNGDNTPDKIFDGFAFDNFFVGQRNRKVVTEEFCDYKNYESTFQGNPLDPQIVRLQYHVRNQNPDDQINNQNMADPSARSLLYGIDQIPRAVIDGVGFENSSFYSNTVTKSGWGPDAFFIRSLQLSPFNIVISHTISGNSNVSVNANIARNSASSHVNPNASFVAQIVVLEDTVMSNGKLFTNVVRNMVPDASGHHIGKWSGTQSLSGQWKPFVKPQSGLKIVVFIQDEDTKEIYQAGIDSISKAIATQFSVGRIEGSSDANSSDFNLYPNPTSGDLNISFYQALAEDASWRIMDVYGVTVLSGTAKSGTHISLVNASSLVNGLYNIQLESSGQKICKTFTVIR